MDSGRQAGLRQPLSAVGNKTGLQSNSGQDAPTGKILSGRGSPREKSSTHGELTDIRGSAGTTKRDKPDNGKQTVQTVTVLSAAAPVKGRITSTLSSMPVLSGKRNFASVSAESSACGGLGLVSAGPSHRGPLDTGGACFGLCADPKNSLATAGRIRGVGISATTRNSLSENGEKLGPSTVRSSRVWKKSHGTHQQGTLHLDSSIAMTSAQTTRGSGGQQLLSDGLMGCAFGAGVGRSVAAAPPCRLSTANMVALEHKMAAVCISEARSGATERAQKRVRFNDAQLEETLKPKPGASALPSSYSFGSTLLPALEARPEEKPASHGSSYGSGGQWSIRDRLHGQSSSRVLPVETLDASMTNVTGSLRYLIANGQHQEHDSSVSALVAKNAELRRDAARGQAPAHSQAMRRHSDAELGAGKGIEKRLENGRARHGVDVSPLTSGGPKQAFHSWQERSVGASQPPFGVSPSENSDRPTIKGNEFKTGLGEKMLSRLSPRASCAQESPSTFGAYSHQTLGGKCSEEAKPAMQMNEKMKPTQQPSCCQHHQPKGLPPARPARQPRSGRRRILSQGKQQPGARQATTSEPGAVPAIGVLASGEHTPRASRTHAPAQDRQVSDKSIGERPAETASTEVVCEPREGKGAAGPGSKVQRQASSLDSPSLARAVGGDRSRLASTEIQEAAGKADSSHAPGYSGGRNLDRWNGKGRLSRATTASAGGLCSVGGCLNSGVGAVAGACNKRAAGEKRPGIALL